MARVLGTHIIRADTKRQYCVYRYIDASDGIVKYVGIVKNGNLYNRIMAHNVSDQWCKGKDWIVQYFECRSQSEVEAFEAHLIALYGTDKYYNKYKAGWGINRYLPSVETWWKPAFIHKYADMETARTVMRFKELLRNGKKAEAVELFEMFVFERGD